MANSVAKDMATLLQTQGVGTLGTDIFYGRMPNSPDLQVSVYDTGSLFISPKYKRDEVTFQVRIRGDRNDHDTGYDLSNSVKNALLGIGPQVVNSTSYPLFVMLIDTTFVAYDDDNRPMWTQNWKTVKENETGGVRATF